MAKATEEQISIWVRKHRDVYEINEGELYGYIRKPDRHELTINICDAQKDLCAFTEEVLNKCWLGGDEKLKATNGHFLGITDVISTIIETIPVTIVKLEQTIEKPAKDRTDEPS